MIKERIYISSIMNTVKQNMRNHSSNFVTDKDVHQAWKRGSTRSQKGEQKKKAMTVSRARLRRGKGYAAPGELNFVKSVEFENTLHDMYNDLFNEN